MGDENARGARVGTGERIVLERRLRLQVRALGAHLFSHRGVERAPLLRAAELLLEARHLLARRLQRQRLAAATNSAAMPTNSSGNSEQKVVQVAIPHPLARAEDLLQYAMDKGF